MYEGLKAYQGQDEWQATLDTLLNPQTPLMSQNVTVAPQKKRKKARKKTHSTDLNAFSIILGRRLFDEATSSNEFSNGLRPPFDIKPKLLRLVNSTSKVGKSQIRY